MNRGLGNMARPYLEELEAMLATDLTEEEGFDFNDFDDKLMEIEQGLMEIPDSITRRKALRLLLLTACICPRHPNGSNKGKHSPAL